jgi:membrane-anchored glycerophosphoryl diester phosphodiesterase (GDPDase)
VQIGELLHPMVGGALVLAAVIMTVVTALRLLFAQPALVSENLGPLAALKRSWEITKGNSWRIFGTLIVFAFIMITIYLILSIPLAAVTSSSTNVVFNFLRGTEVSAAHIFNSLNALILELVLVMLLTTAIFSSLSPSFLTVFYYDLRTRKDGPLMYHEDESPTVAEPKQTS